MVKATDENGRLIPLKDRVGLVFVADDDHENRKKYSMDKAYLCVGTDSKGYYYEHIGGKEYIPAYRPNDMR